MHPVVLYICGCLLTGVIGAISAAIVVGLWWLLKRRTQVRLEMMFAICGLVGGAVMVLGQVMKIPAVSAASLALWGWVVIPILVIPPLLLWRLFAWCRQRIAG